MKIPVNYIIILALVACCLIEFNCYRNKSKDYSTLSNFQKQKDDTIQSYKAKNGSIIGYVQQIQVTKQSLSDALGENDKLKSELDNMKVKLSHVSEVNQIINHISPPVHDTIKMAVYSTDTLPCPTSKIKDTLKFNSKNANYILSGFITKKEIQFTKIDFPDTITTVNENIGNIFKDRYVFKIAHSNPYINTTGAQSLTVEPTKHWYQTTGAKVIAGFILGVYIEKTFLK